MFRSSLRDYKQNNGSDRLFPGERRSLRGLFSGSASRLVYVGQEGNLQEYSYPLSGWQGITSTRIGIREEETIQWLDEADCLSQNYVEDTTLVRTVYDLAGSEPIQRDWTVDSAHYTSFELQGSDSSTADLISVFTFSPEGQEGRVGQLIHDDVIEVYHNEEHNYITASNGFSKVVPQVPERFNEVLAEDVLPSPRTLESDDYEESRLTGSTCLVTPLEDGAVTLTNTVTDITTVDRPEAINQIKDRVASVDAPDEIETRACDDVPHSADQFPEVVKTDLRVIDLLSSDIGARIAGPDFDPFYQNSGGYGYTWFRDDGEIAKFLLETDQQLGLDLDDRHRKSAELYVDTQLDDGRWPHRVWPMNGRLAPGWANGHIEGDDRYYQADQTASVLVFLSTYLSQYRDQLPTDLEEDIRQSLIRGLDGLDLSLESDGLPAPCENAWENMNGRFTHTAANFLHAYSSIATAPIETKYQTRARDRAEEVYQSLEQLWVDERDCFALRITDGEIDSRIDISTVSLVDAHLAYEEFKEIDSERRTNLRKHLTTTFNCLWKETDDIQGLIRFEADTWRRRSQDSEKIWTVSTGWGAYAAEKSITLFEGKEDEYDPYEWSDRLFREIDFGGTLCLPSGYLPEQFFDTGEPDSATPLGWPHAIRLATYSLRQADKNQPQTTQP